jgi:hypothetical protein
MKRIVGVVSLACATILILAGCASSPKMMEDRNGNVHLGVYADTYNFSAQMTRVQVEFDGVQAVNKAFGTTSAGHRDSHYQFYLQPGTHTVHAWANKGGAEATQTFELKERVFIAVQFQPKTAPGGGGIKIKTSPNPIHVQPGQSL